MTRRRAHPVWIGGFVAVGLALVVVALAVLGGGKPFTRKERAVMHFSGSVYGLQVGAPVVFRGVRVGSVASVGVFYDRASDSFSIPVVVELEGDAVGTFESGTEGGGQAQRTVPLRLPALVQRGLSAQLAMQSLLTGLLYVDLDLRPGRPAHTRGTYRGAVEIPTTASGIQALKGQLEGVDLGRIADDLSAIAASARALAAGPELKQALADLAQIAGNAKRVSARLDRRLDPLADELQRSLVATRATLERIGQAAEGVGGAAAGARTLLAADSPLMTDLRAAAEAVATSAASLRQATGPEAPLVRGGETALADLSRAARALRTLAESLEQQPESLLRGRQAVP